MNRWNFFLIVGLGVISPPSCAWAENLPHYKPEELVRYSDLVVVGKQTGPDKIQVEKVLRGQWSKKEVKVAGMEEFHKGYRILRGGIVPNISDQVVVFLKGSRQRHGVVANGFFRIVEKSAGFPDATVLGYSQLMNPGGYELEASPSYQSVADLEKAIQAGIRTLPAFQAKAMDEVAKADL